jgi:hypothetical protein
LLWESPDSVPMCSNLGLAGWEKPESQANGSKRKITFSRGHIVRKMHGLSSNVKSLRGVLFRGIFDLK